ncbi:MAG TPA: M56 family metallopeptidase, partial [Pedobacter sp.]
MESIIFKTLLHSLWQGVLLAVLTALIVLFTTRSTAKVRYNLFVGCLLLFIAGVGATFIVESDHLNSHGAIQQAVPVNPGQTQLNLTDAVVRAAAGSGVLDRWIDYLSNYSTTIVLIWALIICAKSIRFMAGIRILFRVRTTKVYDAGSFLENKVRLLSELYGIKQAVSIVQSGVIQVPMVMGHFKPLILVPLGLVNGLSAAEVDAILSHELAHIRRRDYLVNLFQSMVEILFFFNPAVLWLSNMIRTEREHCCDDLAVATTRTKTDYIKALVSCQEFASGVPSYAMAINGGKKHLVNRVQRLISARNPSLNRVEKAIVGLAMVSSVLLSTAFSGNADVKSKGPGLKPASQVAVTGVKTVETGGQGMTQLLKEYPEEPVNSDPAKAGLYEQPERQQQPQSRTIVMLNQLIREGLIVDKPGAYFKLDADQLMINETKQSAALHEKYRKIYLKAPGEIVYERSVDSIPDTLAVRMIRAEQAKRQAETARQQAALQARSAGVKAEQAEVNRQQAEKQVKLAELQRKKAIEKSAEHAVSKVTMITEEEAEIAKPPVPGSA